MVGGGVAARKSTKFRGMKHVSFMEVWVRVKTMDLSKELRLMASVRERKMADSNAFLRIISRCSASHASKMLSMSLRNEME